MLCFNIAQGQSVGVIFGEPTGLSAKYKHVDAGLAWSFVDDKYCDLHADYLLFMPITDKWYSSWDVTFGWGARIKFAEEYRFGLRFPIGMLYCVDSWELFGEVAPIMDFYPKSELKFNAGIGVRYNFVK